MRVQKFHNIPWLLIGSMMAIVSVVFAGKDITETQTTHQLFFIAHTKNANKVYYEAKVTEEGYLDSKKPIHGYWIMWAKDSSGKTREEFSVIERRMAFGFTVSAVSPHACNVSIAALRNRPVKVYCRHNSFVGTTTIGGRPSIVRKIFVVSNDATLLPRVSSVTLFGTDTANGQETMETIKP